MSGKSSGQVIKKKPLIYGHIRALSLTVAARFAPENTLAAMRCGLDYGFDMVEFDVKLSQDNL